MKEVPVAKYKTQILWLIIIGVLVMAFSNFGPDHSDDNMISYSQFLSKVDGGVIASVSIQGEDIRAMGTDDKVYETYLPMQDRYLLGELIKKKVNVVGEPPAKQGLLTQMIIGWLPFIILIGVYFYFMKQMQGGGRGGPMSFGRSKAKLMAEDQIKVTFKDVAGCEEAKHEVVEIVEFLRDPARFQKLGGRIPRGILLVGPPGTGKTLLAKAVAGEAKVPFFTISGSDFVEMFVGVGASRVRDMFDQAKKQSPCIIFIDEIDAVGRHRGAGLGGGHDEREQTLNQMLVEMDGFGDNSGVIVIAATNRPDVLDPALLRPGRFDRQVVVPLPDIKGREQILQVHMTKVPLEKDASAQVIARGTPGFSGADLANLVNEAAIMAAREHKNLVSMQDLEKAKDKIMMGAERNSMVMDEHEKNLTAYHEAGHAIVGLSVEQHDPVYKVSIIPRGRALGVTMFLPERDRYSYTKQRLMSQIASLFGGRIAEELIFGRDNITTGASNDIERATQLARNMVTRWGLSDTMGPLVYGSEEGEVFLGRQTSKSNDISDATTHTIDAEIRHLIDKNYTLAKTILEEKISILHKMAAALMKYETIDEHQLAQLMKGDDCDPPKGWDDKSSSGKPAQSDESKAAQKSEAASDPLASTGSV